MRIDFFGLGSYLSEKALRTLILLGAALLSTFTTGAGPIEGLKDFVNRLEGTSYQQHGNEDLRLVSIQRSAEKFSRDSKLKVRFYLPTVSRETKYTVFVEAQEKQDFHRYFMQVKDQPWTQSSWNTFEPWPTRDIIDPLGIESGNLAVRAGYRLENHSSVMLPVDLYSKDLVQSKTYTFYFVPSEDLHSLHVEALDSRDTRTVLTEKMECGLFANCTLFPATATRSFELDMSTLKSGPYLIKLVGHVARSGRILTAAFTLYHQTNN